MNFITKYQKYFIVISISFVLGLTRWIFFDKEFPLFELSQTQKNIQLSIEIAEKRKLNNRSSSSKILNTNQESKGLISCENLVDLDFLTMKTIVSNNIIPIIDARDKDSYNEGHIGNAIQIDAALLVEDEDEYEKNKINDFFKSFSDDCIILYCWDFDCHLADYLVYFLTHNNLISESKIFIYHGGWSEWESLYNSN